MTMRFSGAALATLVMLCAAGPSRAAPFSITVGGPTGADGGVSFTLTGDTSATKGEFTYDELEQAPNFLDTLSTSFDDAKATFHISNQSEVPDGFGLLIRSADFMVSDPILRFTVNDTNGTQQTITGYSFAFHAEIGVDPTTGIYYDGVGSSRSLLIPPSSVLEFGPVTVTGNPFVSTVPIPAALPMMAIGLLGLGAFGYASRRRLTTISAI
ncbi:hypothetical protein P7D22_19670 [Lichenihabitans sp. Uapishka_5]|uniref:hypothetical protein n=1 Tax=Lichenihabitans sp. Uapishka_5 TaxID=3037302 RepID=UPI0029E82887|nr:hypothetical protein [Lichenihabitans sp. Uapishka_5]MDX7953387.1 hypothetical protein [Lichenihabitans sp. Uapishka_5]